MTTILVTIHILVSLFLVIIVLLQQGKGASAGATLGGGGSQTMFGSEGPMPLMNKITTGAAIVFMVTSITLAYLSAHKSGSSVMEDAEPRQGSGLSIERGLEPVPGETEDPTTESPGTSGGKVEQEGSAAPAFPLERNSNQEAQTQ